MNHLPSQQRRNLLALCLAGAAAPALCATAAAKPAVEEKRLDLVNILEYQNFPAADWTTAFNRAGADARRVFFPAGDYTLSGATWYPDTEIFGQGDATVLRMPANAERLVNCDSGSSNPNSNVANLHMHHLQLRASSDVDGFSEFKHLLTLNGVTNVNIHDVLFKGFRGDGLYLGSGNATNMERHNRNVSISNCRFDGINRKNRNGITIIDCDGLTIEGNSFANSTMPHMPGAVDVEPDEQAFHVVRNIVIRNNSFYNVGGNIAAVSVFVPAVVNTPAANITVDNNQSDNYAGTGAFFHYNDNRPATALGVNNNIRVVNNRMLGGAIPFLILSGRQIAVQGNTFQNCTNTGQIGATGIRQVVRDLQFVNNTLVRCGSATGNGIAVFSADYVQFSGNQFIDCGAGQKALANAIVFDRGRSSNIVFEGNEFSSPTGRTLVAIQKEAGHLFTPGTNRFVGNQMNGLSYFFQAEDG